MRILLVEDDRSAARGITFQLQQHRMVVDVADCGGEALEMGRLYDYDAVVVDLMLPDMEGYEVVSKLRASRVEAPVLMLSAVSRTQAKIHGLSVGADDYMAEPFDPDELVARLQAMIRRSKGFSRPRIQLGALSLDIGAKEVAVQGRMVHLTCKEYAILELLLMRRGTVLSKENFLDHLYGGLDEPDGKIIDVFVCKLRKKLQVAGAANVIGTVWGRGYIIRDGSGPATYRPSVAEMQLDAV
ncbi:response regulator transcription factor [Roseococcus pinisoli]|uniref:Response regulator transcription factor n=1 Tax=Roseococcus pinisoli TaxID=2835040 RepID=A0ABS5Q8H8_9PROT|nr:response regulator transcription factor [Roseococcus pinisoli]MBS7810000.1 response regulator transcription factor [Roseococcus pinisoli]